MSIASASVAVWKAYLLVSLPLGPIEHLQGKLKKHRRNSTSLIHLTYFVAFARALRQSKQDVDMTCRTWVIIRKTYLTRKQFHLVLLLFVRIECLQVTS
jgi:hypothetical protein